MDKIIELLKHEFLGNEVWRFASVFAAVLAGLVVGRLVRHVMEKAGDRFKRGEQRLLFGLVLNCLAKPMSLLCLVIAVQIGFAALVMTERVAGLAEKVISVLTALTIGYAIYRFVDIIDHYLVRWAEKTESKIDDMLVPLVRKSLRITIVVIVAVFIVESVHGNVATLLAGLGVGGLALALAAQDSIKNFFGSLMILLDKPFQVGDRVVIGGHDGPVEEVGFRSTRIRTLEGHLVTIPNNQVANEVVQNIAKRPSIRRLSNITITYDTPPEKVRRAVEIIREILDNHDGMDPEFPPRIFFNDFNDWSLNIIMIYWYHPPEYWEFFAFSEKVNMQILERFNAEGIEFAFPTHTVYVANDDKRQLALRLLEKQTDLGG